MTKQKSEMTPDEFRRMLEKMSKPELHRFIKENKAMFKKKVTITPFSIKEGWIVQIMEAIFGIKDKYRVPKGRKRRNREIGLTGSSIFGHRLGSMKACMDRRIHEGVLVNDLADELMEKFEIVKDERHAKKIINKYVFSLAEEAKISIIYTLRPDPSKNHVIGVFDEMKMGKDYAQKKI